MNPIQRQRARAALETFFSTPLDEALAPSRAAPDAMALTLFRDVAAHVPAYRAFLAEHAIDPNSIQSISDFVRLPLITKANYLRRCPLPDLCRDGRLERNHPPRAMTHTCDSTRPSSHPDLPLGAANRLTHRRRVAAPHNHRFARRQRLDRILYRLAQRHRARCPLARHQPLPVVEMRRIAIRRCHAACNCHFSPLSERPGIVGSRTSDQ